MPIDLPNLLARGWGTILNNALTQLDQRIEATETEVTSGRLSEEGLTATIAAALADNQAVIDAAVAAMDDLPGSALADHAARIDGYTDHGGISGAVTFNGPTGSHWFNATAPTTITLAGFAEGQIVSLLPFSGAADVTVTGLPDLGLTDGLVASAMLARGVWVTGGGGGGTPATPDDTPPTNVTGLTATGGSGQVTATWTAATDTESSVSYRWRVWLTSGGATGTWTTTTSTSFTKTGLTVAGGYTVEVYAYSNGGASATDTDTATVTVNPFPDADAYDTFARANGTLSGSTVTSGGLTWGSTGAAGLIYGGGDMPLTSGKATGTGGATVDIGVTSATIAADYAISTGRVTVMVGGSTDGTNSVVARLFGSGELKVFHPGGGGTQIGSTVTGMPLTGRIALTYDATDGSVDVAIDGASVFTGTHVGATGTLSGIEAQIDTSTVDNVAWTWA